MYNIVIVAVLDKGTFCVWVHWCITTNNDYYSQLVSLGRKLRGTLTQQML